MAKRKSKQKCMTPGCKRTDIVARGCCPGCYQSHKRRVQAGDDTWESLEERKLVLPLGSRRAHGKAFAAAISTKSKKAS